MKVRHIPVKDRNDQTRRLMRAWARFYRHASDTGVGWDRINLLKRIMKPNPGDTMIRADWSAEERTDYALQWMLITDAERAWAIIVPALWRHPPKGMECGPFWHHRWSALVTEAVDDWPGARISAMQNRASEGYAQLRGMLASPQTGFGKMETLRRLAGI